MIARSGFGDLFVWNEAMLVSKGYKIDEGYQDPDLLPYLQKEPKF